MSFVGHQILLRLFFVFQSQARSYARSKTQIENEKRHFSICIFRSEVKNYQMRSDFGDFRAAFFDLAFSIATSYRNGGDFRSEKMAIEKYCAIRDQGVCMIHSQKPTQLHQRQCKTLFTNQVMRSSACRRYKATLLNSCRGGLHSQRVGPRLLGLQCLSC